MSDEPSLLKRQGILAILAFAAAIAPGQAASSVTLAWDPNPEPDIAGYMLYYGTASGIYTQTNDVGNAATYTVSNLTPGVTYFFAVTAYDTNRVESDFSNEISYTVPGSNSPPAISIILNQTVNEDRPIAVPFTVSDVETPAYALTVTASSSNPALVPGANIFVDGYGTNRTVTIIPATNQFGVATVTLTVSDGFAAASTSFALTVSAVNDLPTLDPIPNLYLNVNPGLISVNLTGITSGASNETQVLSVTASNSNPAFFSTQPSVAYASPNSTGTLTFRPASTSLGAPVITVRVNDGTNIFSRSLTVYVKPSANTAPTLTGIANQTIGEDTSAAALAFRVGDLQTPLNLLTVTGASSNPGLIPNGNIVFGGSGSNRTVTLTPLPNQTGTATITLSVTDTNFGGTNTSFQLTVNATNDPPTISAIADQTINEDTVAAVAFTVGDVETAPGSLTVSGTSSNPSLVSNGKIVFGGSGASRIAAITPLPNQFGTGVITLTITDANGAGASVSFSLTVNPVNDLPTLDPINNLSINADAPPQTVTLSGITSGVPNEADSLTVTATSSNPSLIPNPTLNYTSPNSTGTLTFAAIPATFGSATIMVNVNDGQPSNSITTQTFTVTVNAVNHPPAISGLTNQVTSEDMPITISFVVGDVETPASDLIVSAVSSDQVLVPDANLVLGGSGANRTLTLIPAANAFGTALITVSVSDGGASNNITTQTFTVVVNPVAVPPVPQLRIESFGGQLTLSWPASMTAFQLESTDAVAPANWVPVTEPTLLVQDRMTVSLTNRPSDSARFFRLRKP